LKESNTSDNASTSQATIKKRIIEKLYKKYVAPAPSVNGIEVDGEESSIADFTKYLQGLEKGEESLSLMGRSAVINGTGDLSSVVAFGGDFTEIQWESVLEERGQ
jgi:hypothetical protein